MEIILTIIAILLVIQITVLYEVYKNVKTIPKLMVDLVFGPVESKISNLKKEIKKIKDGIKMDHSRSGKE